MVAIAILAMGLMAVSELVGGALRNHARARQLEIATLLARAKLAEIEDGYEQKGFRDFDEEDDGDFGEEGHPEIRWKLEVVKPDLGTDAGDLVRRLTGKSLEEIFAPPDPGAGASGPGGRAPTAAGGLPPAALGLVQARLTPVMEKLKKGLREARLTVSWGGEKDGGSFQVVTHLVVLQPREGIQ
jgi:general secretion pathway protein I